VAKHVLRIGTRGSALALAQADRVVRRLRAAHPGLTLELRTVRTAGDRDQKRALEEIGGRGVFVSALEDALLAGEIDVAVHSLKDVPTQVPAGLTLAACPERADPHDALVSRAGWSIDSLPEGARVGTVSPRRRGQLLQARPDLRVDPIRGNVDTRLGKVLAGEYDALVLARAGLLRLGRRQGVKAVPIPFRAMLPPAGQGTLVAEVRSEDRSTLKFLAAIDDPALALASRLEREVTSELGAGCHGGLGVLATVRAGRLRLRAAVVAPDGSALLWREVRGACDVADQLVRRLIDRVGKDGGYIASPALDIPKDARPEIVAAMMELLTSK
jgi:hydroxymethylbilane synthase